MASKYHTFPLDNVSVITNETSTQSSAIEDYFSLEVSRTKKKRLNPKEIGYGVALVVITLLFEILNKQSDAPRLNSLETTSKTCIFSIWIANLFQCVAFSRSPPPLFNNFRTKVLSPVWVFIFFIFLKALEKKKFEGCNKKGYLKVKNSKGKDDDVQPENDNVQHLKGEDDEVQLENHDVHLKREDDVQLENDDVHYLKGEVDKKKSKKKSKRRNKKRNLKVKDPKGKDDDVQPENDNVQHLKGDNDEVQLENHDVEHLKREDDVQLENHYVEHLIREDDVQPENDDLHLPKGEVDDLQNNDVLVIPKGEVDDVLNDDVLEIGNRRLLVYTSREIGSGEENNVFEGIFDEEGVAVKRVARESGRRELDVLRNNRHPNVVAYRGNEEYKDFLYIALEKCACNLRDLICQVSLKEEIKAFELWKPNERNRPSVQLIKIMKDIAEALAYLHSENIVHCDLKPGKILIKRERGILRAKLCGLGTSVDIRNTETQNLTGEDDILSLGYVFFYCITQAKHPFGQRDMFPLIDQPEAKDLILKMIAADPEERPNAKQVKKHPLFWKAWKRLEFRVDASDWVEKAIKNNDMTLSTVLESRLAVKQKPWDNKMDQRFLQDMHQYRFYRFTSTKDLLRLIRNATRHYFELSPPSQAILGASKEDQESYFSSRFPDLLFKVYELLVYESKGGPVLISKYKWQ